MLTQASVRLGRAYSRAFRAALQASPTAGSWVQSAVLKGSFWWRQLESDAQRLRPAQAPSMDEMLKIRPAAASVCVATFPAKHAVRDQRLCRRSERPLGRGQVG